MNIWPAFSSKTTKSWSISLILTCSAYSICWTNGALSPQPSKPSSPIYHITIRKTVTSPPLISVLRTALWSSTLQEMFNILLQHSDRRIKICLEMTWLLSCDHHLFPSSHKCSLRTLCRTNLSTPAAIRSKGSWDLDLETRWTSWSDRCRINPNYSLFAASNPTTQNLLDCLRGEWP